MPAEVVEDLHFGLVLYFWNQGWLFLQLEIHCGIEPDLRLFISATSPDLAPTRGRIRSWIFSSQRAAGRYPWKWQFIPFTFQFSSTDETWLAVAFGWHPRELPLKSLPVIFICYFVSSGRESCKLFFHFARKGWKLIFKNDTSVHMESLYSSSNCSTRSLILGMKKCCRKYPKGLASSNLTAKSRVTFSKDAFSSNETYARVTSCYATFVNCIANQPF